MDPSTGVGADQELPQLLELHQTLYRIALENGVLHTALVARELDRPTAEITEAVRDLAALRLLHPTQTAGADAPGEDPGASPTYTANSPDVATAHLNGPVDARIRQLRQRSDQVNNHVMIMRGVFEEARQSHYTRTGVERLTGIDAIRSVLERLTLTASVEIASAHPSLPAQPVIDEGRGRTTEAAERGIRLRTLYPHSVLSHPYMRQHLSTVAGAGVQFRTVGHITDRIILFDADTAVVADPDQPANRGALVIRDRSLARFLYRSWESMWDSGRPFTASDGDPSAAPKDDVRREVLRMLESGMKDEMAARRLSMSATTYRRHVSELLVELGAQSRFQAGSYARRAGWLVD
ncbi:response regulator transcription factor [Streptomyces sp. NPDC002067]